MASANNIDLIPVFELQMVLKTQDLAEQACWRDFKTYLLAADVKEPQRQRALLSYQAGPDVCYNFKTLPDTGDEMYSEKAVNALTKHFEPDKNQLFEICNFRHATQKTEDETIDEFHTRLSKLANTANFMTRTLKSRCKSCVISSA